MILNKLRKTSLVIFTMLFAVVSAVATNATFSNSDYSIALAYTEKTYPGDAIFVHMALTATNKKTSLDNTTATLTFQDETGKKIDKVNFFNISVSKAKASIDMLAGVALSSWLKAGLYSIKVTYTPFGSSPMEFDLPVTVNEKVFDTEVIALNESNTNIRTSESPTKVQQVNKLSKVLMKTDTNAIYQIQKFSAPTTSTRRTDTYASRRTFEYSNGKTATTLHIGIDYGIPTGTPVTSCAAGKVVMAESRITTGWTVVIEHLPGLYSLYYHLDSLSVKEGQMVKMGDIIGKSGSTGLATGPHLHWQMSLNGQAVNPDIFLSDFAFIDNND